MGKRSYEFIVLSSSDEEDGTRRFSVPEVSSTSSKSRDHKEKKRRKNDDAFSCTVNKLQKKSPVTGEDWSTVIPETFSDTSNSKQIESRNQSPRYCQNGAAGLWVDKYKPRTVTELAVNKKKVSEVKAWLEGKFEGSKQLQPGSNVLLLAGPAGVGKTATVFAVAHTLGIEIYEWDTPVPTLWKEYLHHIRSGISYQSKLAEFEDFLGTIQKYPLLCDASSNATGRGLKGILLVIDDMPVVNSRESCRRLCQSLRNLALLSHFPIVITLTHFAEAGDKESLSRISQDLEMALEEGGATKVSFNPLTPKAIASTLSKIWKAEYQSSPPEWLHHVSESCRGDIRNAINSLQFSCLSEISCTSNQQNMQKLGLAKSKSKRRTLKSVSQPSLFPQNLLKDTKEAPVLLNVGRDGILSVFHALGKILHNKRNADICHNAEQSFLRENFLRYPLHMESPELIFSQAHAESGSFSAFLHENVLDFIDDEAIDDAWMAINYLSDSDCLLGANRASQIRRYKTLLEPEEVDTGVIVESIASSIMTRGILFSNSHPAPPRWQSIRGPKLWQVERAFAEKKFQILSRQWMFETRRWNCSFSVLATEYQPLEGFLVQPMSNPQPTICRAFAEEGMESNLEEVTDELDAIELDDFLTNVSERNNTEYVQFRGNLCKTTDEIIEDEIEEW